MGTGNPPYDLLSGIYRPLLDRFRDAAKDPRAAQAARLKAILAANAGTGFGREHGFASITTVEEFRRNVPAGDFETIRAQVERIARGEKNLLTAEPVERFVKTSGTTGGSKWIPVTASLSREVRDAQLIWMVNLLRENRHHPDGRKLTLVSPAEEEVTSAGIPVGANTGRMADALPWFVRLASVPRREILANRDPDVRAFLIALACAGTDAGMLSTANPSTVWLLVRRLREWSAVLAEWLERGGLPAATPGGTPLPRELARRFRKRREQARRLRVAASREGNLMPALWPRLTTVNCWRGGVSKFYLDRLAPELGGIPVRDPGYCASEGFFGIPLESGTAAGVLYCNGPFFEFEPVSGGEPLGAESVVEGQEYALRITTCGGLYRYAMNDVVRIAGRWENAPMLEFVSKSGSLLSVTGEKVSDLQVLAAAGEAAIKAGLTLIGAGATVELADPPRYLALVEAVGVDEAILADGFAAAFDAALRAKNVEYASKRGDGRLGPAKVRYLAPGAFEARRRALVAAGGPETQVKIPVLYPKGWP